MRKLSIFRARLMRGKCPRAASLAGAEAACSASPYLSRRRPADLAAADPAEGAPPVGEATSPDGLTHFALFDRGDDEYWLEVSITAGTELPVIIRLRYTTTERQRMELLVPVGGGLVPPR